MKHAIIMLVYYNYDLIERCLKSFSHYLKDNKADIYFIENPSIHSIKIKELVKKYNINFHYICNENIGGCAFELFPRQNKSLMEKYEYISVTESDVIVENGAIEECIDILDNNVEVPVISIQLNCELYKYRNLPTSKWVHRSQKYKTFYKGSTGFQFIMFRNYVLYDFLEKLNNKKIINPIALGCRNFYGVSDSNLTHYIKMIKSVWARTNSKLDHIGWEKYVDKDGFRNEQHEYCLEKKKHVYRTRSNIILDNMEKYKLENLTDTINI